MSRIRGIEAKKKKKKNEPDTNCEKDDVEKNRIDKLLSNIPELAQKFHIHRKIGEGTFSSVYLGSLRKIEVVPDEGRKLYAVKHLLPITHPSRVAHELRCLRDIGGKNYVIGVENCFRNFDHVVLIMPYMPHRKFSEYYGDMDVDELRRYMRALLTALRHVHTFGVIHRDVKPSNFLYDRDRQRYALVDFGLAQHTGPLPAQQSVKRPRDDDYQLCPAAKRMVLDLTVRPRPVPPRPSAPPPKDPDRLVLPPPPLTQIAATSDQACACAGVGAVCTECAKMPPARANRAGTQGFRPPEVFFKYPSQGTAVDMWAVGVILSSVLCHRYPFFQSADDMTALAEMTALLGNEAMVKAAEALGCRLMTSTSRHGVCLRKLSVHLRAGPIVGTGPRCTECQQLIERCVCRDFTQPAHEFDPTRTVSGFPDAAFALAVRLLEPNPRDRITAAEALLHPFLAQP